MPTVTDVFRDAALHRRSVQGTIMGNPPELYTSDGYAVPNIVKRSGRIHTRLSEDIEDDGDEQLQGRSLLESSDLHAALNAPQLWKKNITGYGIKVGVFDTGIIENHPDVEHVEERTNWTHDDTLDDGLGHGSFVAGVIAGHNTKCLGLAPQVQLHTFKVFTDDQVSFTSWFLDAFNYAMATEMDVVNLSIGGPDYLDHPFVDKVLEVTSSGIIMTSAIGNDGPTYGTMNNPADQNDVIGVGGISYDKELASFSSRGMTTWELPLGYGRAKPDIMAYGKNVQGSAIKGGCRSLSGTSVAAPVVAGAVCLLASSIPPEEKRNLLNPASMKQFLIEGAERLPNLNMFEQGQGALSVEGSYKVLKEYSPRASLVPAILDLTDCPYAWPFCSQPLYAGSMPVMFNVTILNGMGVHGKVVHGPVWKPSNEAGKKLEIRFDTSDIIWPWSGYMALYIIVDSESSTYKGRAEGTIEVTIESPPNYDETEPRISNASMELYANIIPTPDRAKRILWDQFHSIKYPPAYVPRDDLSVSSDILDWHGDHPHTNFHTMFDAFRKEGYFLEVLGSPFTCFNAENYGALMVVDSEDEFYPEEIEKLQHDVKELGLGLIVFADWYDLDLIRKLRFFDDNTRSWWDAVTGGANVPALNDLLRDFGVSFSGGGHEGIFDAPGGSSFRVGHGSALGTMPMGSYIYSMQLNPSKTKDKTVPRSVPILGLTDAGSGRLVIYGDSNCLDNAHRKSSCESFAIKMLEYATRSEGKSLLEDAVPTAEAWVFKDTKLERPANINFTSVSFVLQNPLQYVMRSLIGYAPFIFILDGKKLPKTN